MKKTLMMAATLFLIAGGVAAADELKIQINTVGEGGAGNAIGTVTASESPYGVIFTPDLAGLPPGLHGFHLHQNPDCSTGEKDGKKVPALAAGGHYDPAASGKHLGPYAEGHLGDLPGLFVGSDGKAVTPVLAPRLKLADLTGRSLMIHVGGDNYADAPAPLGGGGVRMACGVIK
jgi:Cu-Zn family superoxide dismutase